MARFESDRQPEILREDLAEVTRLFAVFERITFNAFGEMVATLDAEFPLFGTCIVSLFVREDHLKVYRKGEPSYGEGLFSGYLHELGDNLGRNELLAAIKTKLREAAMEKLQ